MQFEICVKDNKLRQITAARLMSAQVLSGIGAMLFLLQTTDRLWSSIMLFSGITLLVYTLRHKNTKRVRPVDMAIRSAEILLCLAFIVFAINNHFVIPAIIVAITLGSLVFAMILERNSKRFSTVKINTRGVSRPLVFKKAKMDWPEIDQVLLRFGTLTINCNGNRFYQYSIDNYDFDTEAFENFCNQQITEGKAKRIHVKNDW